ncbi:MAG: A/G-specific adenine glycosylase [Deltaproteobacteria bacterium]|nr:A/G-specific adenine glycosylase [Deltaproteobacteria bacterium]
MKSTEKILKWYDKNRRDLPWRLSKPDPYKTWISEMMLQQTQVDTVLPYYSRFLKQFPNVTRLAEASIDEVLKIWSGLGYYSRARNLHKAAGIIVHEHGGCFPSTRDALLTLPGIGPYSAGAIASIAFNEPVPLVDGNVIRVLTRLFALKGDPKAKPLHEKLWALAAGLVSKSRPGDFNQALMELGALVCTPKDWKCGICPLKKECQAFITKKVADYPTPPKKQAVEKVSLIAALIEKNGSYLLARRGEKKHLQSMWEFPQIDPCHLGLDVESRGPLAVVRHAIMNRSIRMTPHLYRFRKGKPKLGGQYVEYQWIRPAELKNFPTSSLNHKICSIIS